VLPLKRLFPLFAVILCAIATSIVLVNLGDVLHRIYNSQPDAPAFEQRMSIDSMLFAHHGKTAATNHDFLRPTSIVHSVAMQILVGVWFYLRGETAVIDFKVLNSVLWLASIVFTGLTIHTITNSISWGFFAAALLAGSNALASYTAILQHESWMTALCAASIYFISRPTAWRMAGLGATMTALSAFRVTYLIPSVLLTGWIYSQNRCEKRKTSYTIYLMVFITTAMVWNLLLSLRINHPYVFFPLADHTFKGFVNPAANPAAFPMILKEPPYGMAFVIAQPLAYLKLVFAKIPYFLGTQADIWFVESRGTLYIQSIFKLSLETSRTIFVLLTTLTAFAGLVAGVIRKASPVFQLIIFYLMGFIPFVFLFGASTRFVVPSYPMWIVCQTWALYQLVHFSLRQTRALLQLRGADAATTH